MSRRSSSAFSWSLDTADPAAVPNARTVHGLLRCIRRLPGAFPSHQFDDLGAALAPVLEALRPKVVAALKAHLHAPERPANERLEIDLKDPSLLHDHEVQTLVGEGLARSTVAFRTLSDQIDTFLAAYTGRHGHATDRNVEMLAQMLPLFEHESAFLRLVTATGLGSVERSLFAFVPGGGRVCKAIEAVCGARGPQASRMLDPDGALARSGLLLALGGRRPANDMEDLLVLSTLGERLLSVPYESAAEMAGAVLTALPAAGDGAALDWPHLSRQQALLAAALSEVLARGTPGFNVLLHGLPGTGKTAFARQLIEQIGGCGYAIGCRDAQGDEAARSDRLASLRLSQCFAGQRQRTVLVLDEAEDIFQSDYNSPLARVFGKSTESKGWVNGLLESNPSPVIWISNQVDHLDPAYLRRFSFCIEFPRTPLSLRRRIAEGTLSAIGCSPQTIETVAADEHTPPALLAAAAQFASLAHGSGLGPDSAVVAHLDEHAKARGQTSPRVLAPRTQRFDLRYLNFDGNVTPQGLLQALGRDPMAAVAFAGPPGTGKTQFAAEIARHLDRQLVVRTASDINSKWYGESEANVAKMFRQCDPMTEVLFLDEAEILLAARESTGQRADRAVTAEFLRWLEVFEGSFICATNHVADFDAALMRRFAFRVHFQPLTVDQRLTLYAEQALGWQPDAGTPVPALDAQTVQRLTRLDLLTPGDFANAGRRARRLGLDGRQWLDEMEAEHAAKGGAGKVRIGFV